MRSRWPKPLRPRSAFQITPTGLITEIINATGDGAGNVLGGVGGIALDAAGNVYVTGLFSDNVFKISPDCNNNTIPDETDIATGASQDCNANSVPDECETDSNGDGAIDDCDNCPSDPNKTEPGICGCGEVDTDGDGVADCDDNCPAVANADQADSDGNGVGDVCEPPPAGQLAGNCCGGGMDAMMVMPMTLLGIGWMRRRRPCARRSSSS